MFKNNGYDKVVSFPENSEFNKKCINILNKFNSFNVQPLKFSSNNSHVESFVLPKLGNNKLASRKSSDLISSSSILKKYSFDVSSIS